MKKGYADTLQIVLSTIVPYTHTFLSKPIKYEENEIDKEEIDVEKEAKSAK